LSRSVGLTKAAKYKDTRAWAWARESWLGELVRACRAYRRELIGWVRKEQATYPSVESLRQGLAALHSGAVDAVAGEGDTEAPIFLFSIGWRTGSTLLQRIMVTDPRLLLWGEPLGDMAFLSRIAGMVSDSLSPRNLELWKKQGSIVPSSLANSWIANLYPPGDDFRLALRSLCDRWLGQPARELGFSRWGFKEVRLGAAEACLLHWLYPQAKFVILARHPYDCYRSLADSLWQNVYFQYPDISIDCAANFARHWNRLAISWSELPAEFPLVQIRYEDLTNGKFDFRKLESWLGIEVRENVALEVSVGGTATRAKLNWFERLIIEREARPGMRAFDYSK
jgi:sulfotransferase family protein